LKTVSDPADVEARRLRRALSASACCVATTVETAGKPRRSLTV
jgi:hypothetical protein